MKDGFIKDYLEVCGCVGLGVWVWVKHKHGQFEDKSRGTLTGASLKEGQGSWLNDKEQTMHC